MSQITKFSQAVQFQIVAAIRAGCGVEQAAASAGLNRVSVWRWLQRGLTDAAEGLDTEYSRFAEAYKEAEASVIAKVEQNVVKQTGQDWRAGAWWLSKRKPEVYDREASAVVAQRVVDALLDRIRQRCSPETYQDVIDHALDDAIEVKEIKAK